MTTTTDVRDGKDAVTTSLLSPKKVGGVAGTRVVKVIRIPPPLPSQRKKKGRRVVGSRQSVHRHPWEKWFAPGTTTVIVRGRDYTSQPHGMRNCIKNAARRMGVRTLVKVDETKISITVLGRVGPGEDS